MDGQKGTQTDGQLDRRRGRQTSYGQKDEETDGWMDGRTDGQTDGRSNQWILS